MEFEGHTFSEQPTQDLLAEMGAIYCRPTKISTMLLAMAQLMEEELGELRGERPKADSVMEETIYHLRSLAVQEDIAEDIRE